MIAWQSGISQEADSHLVCVQEGQSLTTQLLAKGHSRKGRLIQRILSVISPDFFKFPLLVTGASFVIFDSGLKSTEDIFQVP